MMPAQNRLHAAIIYELLTSGANPYLYTSVLQVHIK